MSGVLSLADSTCTSVWQEAEWRWRGVERMRRTNWRSCKQENKHVISWCFSLLSFNLCQIWSIYFRSSEYAFGSVKFSYVLAQMACKFQIPKSLTGSTRNHLGQMALPVCWSTRNILGQNTYLFVEVQETS